MIKKQEKYKKDKSKWTDIKSVTGFAVKVKIDRFSNLSENAKILWDNFKINKLLALNIKF